MSCGEELGTRGQGECGLSPPTCFLVLCPWEELARSHCPVFGVLQAGVIYPKTNRSPTF